MEASSLSIDRPLRLVTVEVEPELTVRDVKHRLLAKVQTEPGHPFECCNFDLTCPYSPARARILGDDEPISLWDLHPEILLRVRPVRPVFRFKNAQPGLTGPNYPDCLTPPCPVCCPSRPPASTVEDFQAMLLWGAGWCDQLAVRTALSHGVDVHVTDSFGLTALYWCLHEAHEHRVEMVELLLSRGANPNTVANDLWEGHYADIHGPSPMHVAVCNFYTDDPVTTRVVELLLAAGGDANLLDARGRTPLLKLLAASSPSSDLVKTASRFVLHGKTDLGVVDEDGISVLDYLAQHLAKAENNEALTGELINLVLEVRVKLGAPCDESSGGGGSVGVAADERAVDGMCVSCRDARAVYCCLPCGHKSFCDNNNCLVAFGSDASKTCPVCQTPVGDPGLERLPADFF